MADGLVGDGKYDPEVKSPQPVDKGLGSTSEYETEQYDIRTFPEEQCAEKSEYDDFDVRPHDHGIGVGLAQKQ